MTDAVRDEMIEMRGLQFHYRDWACTKPDAQTLLLLHGYTGHARSWDAFARAMSNDYRVLALDQRGHGESGWAGSSEAYATEEMVEDVVAFVAALGLEKFVLLGLSMGGQVAIGYAGRRPPELERLVIVDIAPEIAKVGLERILAGVVRPDVFDTREQALAQAREDNPLPPLEHQRERVWNSMMRTDDGRWTYRYDRALRDPQRPRRGTPADEGWRLVSRIAVPTLLVRGEVSDILDEAVADRMIRTLPDGRLVTVPESSHPVPLDRPDGFLAAVRTFL